MPSFLSRAPSRSYEPLAIRICKALYAIADGKGSQWVSVAQVSQFIKVKDEELLHGAITLAAQKGWLMVGGQPVHSLFLTDTGEAVTLKKSGHSNAPMPKVRAWYNIAFGRDTCAYRILHPLACRTRSDSLLSLLKTISDSIHDEARRGSASRRCYRTAELDE